MKAVAPRDRLYGRSQGRNLTPRQQRLLETGLPKWSVPFMEGQMSDPRDLFPGQTEIWLEIGFGGGEHMAGQAMAHPNVGIIGAEPFLNGVVSALDQITTQRIENVRLHHGDARPLVRALPDNCLTRVFILFPDPWPKNRHHKRRIISDAFVPELVRVLKPGGQLRFVTDWMDYAGWAVEHLSRNPDLLWQAQAKSGWLTAPADHIVTRYQTKALGDTAPVFLDFIKVESAG